MGFGCTCSHVSGGGAEVSGRLGSGWYACSVPSRCNTTCGLTFTPSSRTASSRLRVVRADISVSSDEYGLRITDSLDGASVAAMRDPASATTLSTTCNRPACIPEPEAPSESG